MDRTDTIHTGGGTLPPPDFSDDFEADTSSTRGDDSSLVDGIEALFTDGKTYLEAEVRFQKSRAGYTADRAKWFAVYGAGAFAFLHLALIALTVGLVIALATLVGPGLATLIVVVVLLGIAGLFVMRLRSKINDIADVFGGDGK